MRELSESSALHLWSAQRGRADHQSRVNLKGLRETAVPGHIRQLHVCYKHKECRIDL